MSGSGSAAGLRVLARLLLWLAVLIGGFLYLSAIGDRGENADNRDRPSTEKTARGAAGAPPGSRTGEPGAPDSASEMSRALSAGPADAAVAPPPIGPAEPAESGERSAGAASAVAQARGTETGERPQQGGTGHQAAQRTAPSGLTPAEAEAFAKAVISQAVGDAGTAEEPPGATATGSAAGGDSPAPPTSGAATVGAGDSGPSRPQKPAAPGGRSAAGIDAMRWRADQGMLNRRYRGPWPGWHIPYPSAPPGPLPPRRGP
jgi:hypothetical protein